MHACTASMQAATTHSIRDKLMDASSANTPGPAGIPHATPDRLSRKSPSSPRYSPHINRSLSTASHDLRKPTQLPRPRAQPRCTTQRSAKSSCSAESPARAIAQRTGTFLRVL